MNKRLKHDNMLRKVRFKKWIPGELRKGVPDNEWPYEKGTQCYEEGYSLTGYFHKWINEHMNVKAIVEIEDGTLQLVEMVALKFERDEPRTLRLRDFWLSDLPKRD